MLHSRKYPRSFEAQPKNKTMYRIEKNNERLLKVETVSQAIHAICSHKGQPASETKIKDAQSFFANSPKSTYKFDECYSVERAQI